MSAELELKLGRIASLAHRARVALSRGCLSGLVDDDDTPVCDGSCGGHKAIGWTLDPAEVHAAIGDNPGTVVDLVVDRDQLADRAETLAAALRAADELQAHTDCPLCARRARGCGEVRDWRRQIEAAQDLIKEVAA